MPDKNPLHAWLVGLAVAALWAAMQMVALIFADPPTKSRELKKAAAEKVLAIAVASGLARLSAPWATEAVNAVIAWLPLKLALKVDPLTAAAVVATLTLTLIADPGARSRLLGWVKKFIPGGAQ